jgi:HlyD family secretion protein
VALVVAGVVAFLIIPGAVSTGEPPELNVRRAQAEAGNIVITISAAGSVEPEQVASLYFPTGVIGVVDDLRVDLGTRVSEGEILAGIEADVLEISHEQAGLQFDIQELRNEQVLEPPSENDLAAAKADVGAAATRYGDVANPDPELLEIQRLQSQQAVHSYNAADINYDGLHARSSMSVSDNAHAKAGISWVQSEIARLQYEQMLAGPRPGDLAVASAEVSLAAARLDQEEATPSEFLVERGNIELERAKIAIDRADEQLARTILQAPFDGVISVVNVREGTPPPLGEPAVELIDDSIFHIDVEVDEIDIGQVEVGQPVFVELDALPDRSLTGAVVSISPAAATDGGGVVSYIVRVDLDQTNVPLRAGMTSTVDIVVQQVEGALRVPNWAIRIDRGTGDTFVSVMGPDGGLVEIDVELGLRGDAYSEVISGLEEDDEVLVSLDREDFTFFGGSE